MEEELKNVLDKDLRITVAANQLVSIIHALDSDPEIVTRAFTHVLGSYSEGASVDVSLLMDEFLFARKSMRAFLEGNVLKGKGDGKA